jgi:SAM-dependent methyltransferase
MPVNPELVASLDAWRPDATGDLGLHVAALLESLQAASLLRCTTNAVLLGEQYHLGGAEDTRRMAKALDLTAADRVLDLACYVGGPARQLAREYGCQVVGVDISEDCIAIAGKLTELCGLTDRVQFICCSADSVPLPDESFTVAWSQCSFPSDLSWLPEIHRLLAPGGRLGFTGLIRRSALSDPSLPSLEELRDRVATCGFRVLSAEDISEMDLEYGWYRSKEKLRKNDAHYCSLMGEEWVRQAYAELDIDTESGRTGREGNGRCVAVKE